MVRKPTYEELRQEVKELKKEATKHKRAEERAQRLNRLKEDLLASGSLNEKLKRITDCVVETFDADFCRIWITKPGDLCDSGCFHANVTEGPHVCRYRDRCLHLMASSGRYTHIDGGHGRVPFGCYKIGRVTSGEDPKFITNDVTHDPQVHDNDWARRLGLVSFVGYRVLSADGMPIGVLALFSKNVISPRDDTLLQGLANTTAQVIQTTKAEEALQESQKRYRELWDDAPVAYHMLDTRGIIKQVNQTEIDMLGYTRDEMLGKPIFDFILPEQRKEAEQRFRLKLAGKNVPKKHDRLYVKKDGSKMYVSIDDVLEYDSDGKLIGVRTTMVDVSQEKRAEEALRKAHDELEKRVEERTSGLVKANELLKREIADRKRAEEAQRESEKRLYQEQKRMEMLKFANDLSLKLMHELRNPLVAIGGFAARIFNGDYPKDKLKEYTGLIFEESKRLDNVLEEVVAHLKTASEQV